MTYEELKNLLDMHRKLSRSQDMVCGYIDNEPIGNIDKLVEIRSKFHKLHEWFINFLNSTEDLYIKSLIYKRFDKGYSWIKIAMIEGGIASEESHRKSVTRYLEKVAPSLPPFGE